MFVQRWPRSGCTIFLFAIICSCRPSGVDTSGERPAQIPAISQESAATVLPDSPQTSPPAQDVVFASDYQATPPQASTENQTVNVQEDETAHTDIGLPINGDFSDWPNGQTLPTRWNFVDDSSRESKSKRAFTITRHTATNNDGAVENAVKQAWQLPDAKLPPNRKFGCDVDRIKPRTYYRLRIAATNLSKNLVSVKVYGGDELDSATARPLATVAIEPKADRQIQNGYFSSQDNVIIRICTDCGSAVSREPIIWESFSLYEGGDDANLMQNGSFDIWPSDTGLPLVSELGFGYENDGEFQSYVERATDPEATGYVAKQTWVYSDGAASASMQFGTTVENLKPFTTYILTARAKNLGKGQAQISTHLFGQTREISSNGNVLDNPLILEPGPGWRTLTATFTTSDLTTARFVASSLGEQFPNTVLWDEWRLVEAKRYPSTTTSLVDHAYAIAEEAREIDSYREYTAEEDESVLDNTLSDIFGANTPPQTEKSLIVILSYVSQALTTGSNDVKSDSATANLAAGKGMCHNFAAVMKSLCKRIGYPARSVVLENIPYLFVSHVMCEVYYDGAWHLFDPTFATFFYSSENYDGKGHVCSLRELATDPRLVENVFQIYAGAIHTGRFQDPAKIRKLPQDYREGITLEGKTVAEFYRNAFAVAFPIIEGYRRSSISYPVVLDLSNEAEIWHGAVDGSTVDVTQHFKDGEYTPDYGAPFLGANANSANFITLRLRVPKPGTVRVTFVISEGKGLDMIKPIELDDALISKIAWTSNSWTMECQVRDREGIVLIDYPQFTQTGKPRFLQIDAIHAEYLH